MTNTSVPQLAVNPNNTASLIRSDSIFHSKKIILSGDDYDSGIALKLTNISNKSIQTLGGLEVDGKIVSNYTNDVSITSSTERSAAVEIKGGLLVEKDIYSQKNIQIEGSILNEGFGKANTLVSNGDSIQLDIVYCNAIYAMNYHITDMEPPSELFENSDITSGIGYFDILIVNNFYCSQLHTVSSDFSPTEIIGDRDDDLEVVVHAYMGDNLTGKYAVFKSLSTTFVFNKSSNDLHIVSGRYVAQDLLPGFGGFGKISSGSVMPYNTYIGGVNVKGSWKLDFNLISKHIEFKQHDGVDYYMPETEYRIWMAYNEFSTMYGSWNVVRARIEKGKELIENPNIMHINTSGDNNNGIYLNHVEANTYEEGAWRIKIDTGGNLVFQIYVIDYETEIGTFHDGFKILSKLTDEENIPSGYSISSFARVGDVANFTVSNAVINASLTYTITSSDAGCKEDVVSVIENITTSTVSVSDINVCDITSEILTLTIKQTDSIGREGREITKTYYPNTISGSKYQESVHLNTIAHSDSGFYLNQAMVGVNEVGTWRMKVDSYGDIAFQMYIINEDTGIGNFINRFKISTEFGAIATSNAPIGYSISTFIVTGTTAVFTMHNAVLDTFLVYTIVSSGGGGSDVSGIVPNITSSTEVVSNIDISELYDGILTLSVKLTDDLGNEGEIVTQLTVLGSGVSISDEQQSEFSQSSITIDTSGDNENGLYLNQDIPGNSEYGTWRIKVDLQGSLAFQRYIIETGECVGNFETRFKISSANTDVTIPYGYTISVFTIGGGKAAFTMDSAEINTSLIYVISSASGGEDVAGTVDNITSGTETVSNIDISGLNDGTLTLSVKLMDDSGNVGLATTATALLDTNTAPEGGGSIYFLQKSPNREISYISCDITHSIKGALDKGYWLDRIYVTYKIMNSPINSITPNVYIKSFDRNDPSGDISFINVQVLEGSNIMTNEAKQIGNHHRFILLHPILDPLKLMSTEKFVPIISTEHRTFSLEIEIDSPELTMFNFYGCYIEFYKKDLMGF